MKKVTINQVAEAAGVSKTTISRFLNGHYGNMSKETKEKIAAVIEELNYRPNRQAQSLKSKHSYLIGVVVADISNMYSSLLLKGMGVVLEKSGYQMIIVDAANSVAQEHELLQKLLDQSVEGVILQPSSRDSAHYEFISKRGIPLLLVDRPTDPEQWASVTTNNFEATEEVLVKALKMDYQKVVVVTEPIKDVSTREVRYHAAKTITENVGKEVELLETTLQEDLKEEILKIIAAPKKALLFASNGRVLMALLAILIEEEIAIPEKVGITGFDDWNLTELVGPGITSIEQQSRKIGEVAAEKMLNCLQKEEPLTGNVVVPSEVKWRKSI